MNLGALLTTVALVLIAGVAHAEVLFTQPIAVGTNQTIVCRIANVGAQERTVSITVIDSTGGTVTSSGDLSIPSGQTAALAAVSLSQSYCKFSVERSKTAFRAGASLRDSTTGIDFFAGSAN
jgi:hypothetical protein